MNNLQCTMNVQNEMKVQLAFVDGRPHVEFCGTSREGASEADISEMPIEYAPQTTKKYNPSICDELGIQIPEGYEPVEG